MTPADCPLLAEVDAVLATVDLDEHEAEILATLAELDQQAKAQSRPTMRPGKDCGR